MELEDDYDYGGAIDTGEIEDEFKSEGTARLEDGSETTSIPINPATDILDTKSQAPTIDTIPGTDNPTKSSTAKGRLRHQKSIRFNKGGAFHAQTFTKSLATREKSGLSRASILDTDWTPKDDTNE